ncbi:MAG: hypothetical protein QF535_14345, partial [Anaerolineales bacterium]|nr:hypothetical protein [Anaerolineales bacterium]
MEKKLYYTLLVLLIIVIAALAVFAITPPNGHEVSQLDLTPITIVGDDVGIGTTNPDGQLDLFGKLKSQGSSTGTHSTGWRMDVEGGSDWAILSTGSTYPSGPNKLVFFDEAAGANRMVIDSLGNIGIGTTSPKHTLDIGSTNFGLQKMDVSPNAGYLRFGDSTG